MATAYNGRRQYSPLSTPAPNRAGELQQQQQMRYYRSPQPATVGAPIHTVVDDERKTRIRYVYLFNLKVILICILAMNTRMNMSTMR